MDKNKAKEDFLTIIYNYPKEVQHSAIELRELIFKIFPETVAVPWATQKVWIWCRAKKMSEHFCYMVFAKKHINFGFSHGANLNDPKAILSGTGKKFRNTKIKSTDDINNPDLTELIKESIRERKEALKKYPHTPLYLKQ